MKIQKSFRLAVNILVHSKVRSWLTIIGIVIGVAAIVAIVSIGDGAQASVNSRLSGLGADLVSVNKGYQRAGSSFRGFGGGGGEGASSLTQKNLTTQDIQVLRTVDGITFINGVVSGRLTVVYLAQGTSLSIQGVDPLAWQNILTTSIASGRLLNPSDDNVVVIGSAVATTTYKTTTATTR